MASTMSANTFQGLMSILSDKDIVRPLELYTYETAHAVPFLKYEGAEAFELVNKFISAQFGRDKMDNKITVRFAGEGVLSFMTYWDNKVFFGSKVNIMANLSKKENAYRIVKPL